MANEMLNVKKSFEIRVAAQLEISTSIDWQGTVFNAQAVTEWVEPRLLGETSTAMRKGERFELWTAQFNCYARTGFDEFGAQRETTHRVWELADLVLTAFGQHDLAVLDHADGETPEIFRLRFDEGSVTPVPASGVVDEALANLQQLNVSFNPTLIG